MPEIELHGNGMDPGWIHALMNFPSDAKLRRSYHATHFVRGVLNEYPNRTGFEFGREVLEYLISAPSHDELRDLSAKQIKCGYIAGDFLLSIYAMYSFPDYFKEPSVAKAIFVTQAFALRTEFGDGSRVPTSETAIRKVFNEFRSVAHLWAAMRLHQSLPIREHSDVLGSAEAVCAFLGIAGTLQDFGCNFVPKRATPREPILDRNSLWSVPAEFARLTPPWRVPPEWLVDAAKRYRAKVKGSRPTD